MSTEYKRQEHFAHDLAMRWLKGDYEFVRHTIRTLKNKAQAAYIAARIILLLVTIDDQEDTETTEHFLNFIHPNEGVAP